eukprot:12117020-Alexandrium_andersonii.AAC.1
MLRSCWAMMSLSGRATGRTMRGSARSHLVCSSTCSSKASPSMLADSTRLRRASERCLATLSCVPP